MHTENCLLIDDDADDREVFGMCLRKVNPNINFRTLNDGVEAVSVLNNEKNYVPDFIFLDMNMPRMKGIECLEAIKKIPRLKNTKVYMYSTTAETAAVTQSIKLGAVDFIIKPAKTVDLKEKLAKIFSIVTKINQPLIR